MPDDTAQVAEPPNPVTSLDDPRAVQILTAEHGSLLSARSLAYNEAFARAGMFLASCHFRSWLLPCWRRCFRSTKASCSSLWLCWRSTWSSAP